MNEQIVSELKEALIAGNIERSGELAKAALGQGIPAKTLLVDGIKQAADVIGQKYDDGEYFLANLVRCGDSIKAAIKQFEAHLAANPQAGADATRVVIGTVEDDIHDIGKNLVVTFLQGDGFVVDDMGVDVSAQRLVDRAVETQARVIAVSCLMSVTRNGVKKVCEELEARGLRDRFAVLVGGAATNAKWAKQVGCDGWAASATEASHVARSLVAERKAA